MISALRVILRLPASSSATSRIDSKKNGYATTHRYWRRQAQDVIALVSQFSAPAFTAGLGAQGELMFDAALPTVGFLPTARKVKAYSGKKWMELSASHRAGAGAG